MRNILSGLTALALALTLQSFAAWAGSGTVAYKPGIVKSQTASGQAVLLHYKSTW